VTRDLFVTGGTGYVGRPLIAQLVARGHRVRALVRRGSESKVPPGAEVVLGNALDCGSWAAALPPADTLIHLVGTPHPGPGQAAEFQQVDLVSIRAAVSAAVAAGIGHFIYVSVAHPAPVMHDYIAVRRQGEALIEESGIPATILRPWYVLGPGHRWPYVLIPFYAVARFLPRTRATATRLGLVSRRDMVAALAAAVDQPPERLRVVDVPAIRSAGAARSPGAPGFPFPGAG
jgi:uncharacterized protein YbjT (DUF2867 family)